MNRTAAGVLAAFACVLVTPTEAVEILRWERLPLSVPLIVDQERVVFVDRNIRVGVPAGLADRLRVQSAGGALYLRAGAPIESTRLQLQDADTGAVILLDITAEPAQPGLAPLEPIRIIEATTLAQPEPDAHATTGTPSAPATPLPVVLTRYAAQNLYAPLRTVEPLPGIVRVNLRRDLALGSLLPTLPVQADALAAWRLDDTWISAVRLRNASARGLTLDPRALQGRFVTATFQHATLGPAGTPEDTTVVYLVTQGHGLSQALLPTLAPVDASLNLPAPGRDGGRHAQ